MSSSQWNPLLAARVNRETQSNYRRAVDGFLDWARRLGWGQTATAEELDDLLTLYIWHLTRA